MEVRSARLRSLAKVNLDLRVLHKRADGFHELRTIFQTISLSDRIDVSYTPGVKTSIEIAGNVEIPGNLIVKASERILEATRSKGLIQYKLTKRIPMGGGLGGGSSNAAAILLALPALLGKSLSLEKLHDMAVSLGSDVAFFLFGGSAVGLGRGSELYPLPELAKQKGLLAAPGLHIPTPDAYRNLNRGTLEIPTPDSFREAVWDLSQSSFRHCLNHFETDAYKQYPKLRAIHKRLARAGAKLVRMSGSGSSIFAFFDQIPPDRSILEEHRTVHRIETVTRRQYQKLWRRQLREHITPGETWPPHSRYAQ
jgi:4-diphosphocytidyl-2-C-methyl-D-erythritol kinase